MSCVGENINRAKSLSRTISSLLCASWLVLIIACGWESWYVLPIDREKIRPDSGCCYIVDISTRPLGWPFITFAGDIAGDSDRSRLIFLENGAAIGSPHTLHDDIRTKGEGRYSHWNSSVFFSAPGCSDPRSSEKQYSIRVPARASRTTSMLLQVVTILCPLRLFFAAVKSWSHSNRFKSIIKTVCFTCELEIRPLLSCVTFMALLLAALGCLLYTWAGHYSHSLSLAGMYQISDASHWWRCGNTLRFDGTFGAPLNGMREWCQRRPIYPGLLATLSWLGQGDIAITLVLQLLVITMGIFFLLRQSSNLVGLPAIVVMAALLVFYSAVDVFNLSMSENAGLLFGCLSLSAFIKASERPSLSWYALGCSLLSVALNARAGAFLVLPATIVAAAVIAKVARQSLLKWIAATCCAAAVGFVLQAVFVWLTGGHAGSSHGNFSYTLYGLSIGGKGWSQVLVDHPELTGSDTEMSSAIYRLAFKNITDNPWGLIEGLSGQIEVFLSRGTYGYQRLGDFELGVHLLWWLGLVPILRDIRKPAMTLMLAAATGVFASAPFLLSDGGPRIFAATIPLDVLQVGIGLNWLISTLSRFAFMFSGRGSIWLSLQTQRDVQKRGVGLAVLATAAIAMVLAPYIVKLPRRSKPLADYKRLCDQNLLPILTQLGGSGSLLLSLDEWTQPLGVIQGQFNHDKLVKGLNPSTWYSDDVKALQRGAAITAFQLDTTDPYWPGPYKAIIPEAVSQDKFGRLAVLCLDPRREIKHIGDSYRSVVSYSLLNE